ncbi:MAG: hypothetical protein SVX43_19340 [Cyanobacteriota bacterium]|nr:hypothetical protein [Cyanobacteriota bacterium]
MEIYEFSFLPKVSFANVAGVLSQFFGISLERIGSEDDFYNQLEREDALEMGMTLHFAEKGYKTLLDLSSMKNINDEKYIELASQLARSLKTNAVIADVTKFKPGIDRFLVFYPNGKCQRAYNTYDEEGNFYIEPFSETMTPAEVIQDLRKEEGGQLLKTQS